MHKPHGERFEPDLFDKEIRANGLRVLCSLLFVLS